MLPGPDQIIACPSCHGLARYGTLMSGNTFGARIWTDGKRVAPMLPQPPAVVKCGHCGSCYWLADAEKIGELDAWGEDPLSAAEDWSPTGEDPLAAPANWRTTEYVEEPEEHEYYAALRSGLAQNAQQERALRIFAWWRSNEPDRDDEVPAARDTAARTERDDNLRALLTLLSGEDDRDRVMRGEVLRELGRWAEAEESLGQVTSPDFAPAVDQIRTLCRAEDTRVRELTFN